jgi:hypothetical protein
VLKVLLALKGLHLKGLKELPVLLALKAQLVLKVLHLKVLKAL